MTEVAQSLKRNWKEPQQDGSLHLPVEWIIGDNQAREALDRHQFLKEQTMRAEQTGKRRPLQNLYQELFEYDERDQDKEEEYSKRRKTKDEKKEDPYRTFD